MDLPEGPPGAEGYEDSVVEVPSKKPDLEECTKAEKEFQAHVNSLKIQVEDETYRPMVERRGRDVSGKWVYLCYPCHAMCSGESILQTHISGKKHKHKIASRTIWPYSIFTEHPYVLNEKGQGKDKPNPEESEKTLQKMAEEVKLYNSKASEFDKEFGQYRELSAQITDSLNALRAPLVGVEYLIEHPGEESHHEPSYTCTLCIKQGHPRTIINHLTCFWHRYNYINRHYQKACTLLSPYRVQTQYREGAALIINRLIQRIEDSFGRQRPLVIDKSVYEKRKDQIHQWISKSYHFSETNGPSFEEVIDVDLIISLHKSDFKSRENSGKKSPPAGEKPKSGFNSFSRPPGRQERRAPSLGALSDVSNDDAPGRPATKRSPPTHRSSRFEPYHRGGGGGGGSRDREHEHGRGSPFTFRSRYAIRNTPSLAGANADKDKPKGPNYEHKVKLAADKREEVVEASRKMLAYHEKNPEKHPLYPEEWKKFWNKRYKEIVAEGKEPSKHDFKPEWIVYWTKRMKELHDLELKSIVDEIYRKFNLTPPPVSKPERRKSPERGPERRPPDRGPERRRSPEPYRRAPEPRRRSPDPRRYSPATMQRRDIEARRRSPGPRRPSPSRRRSPSPRRPSPSVRRRSPSPRRRSPSPRRRSPSPRRPSPSMRRRSPSPHRRPSPPRRRSPQSHYLRTRSRSRSPVYGGRGSPRPSHSRPGSVRSRSPGPGPARTSFVLDALRRSESPLSRREHAMRNQSPARSTHAHAHAPLHNAQLISDDELRPDVGTSPWNSDNDISSLPSLPDARSPPPASLRRSHSRPISEHSRSTYAHSREHRGYSRVNMAERISERDIPEDVVSVLRLLVALEDYLGSLGPKIVDLLTDALKMEKERANSSEELLDNEQSVFLIETAKEKLKGASQAGLVRESAVAAVRAAIVKVAGLLHLSDKRAKQKAKDVIITPRVGVAGVGEVERAQIAEQMAAALIEQGKTDVTAEELAQLVEAVVGMAEAKKREAAKAAEPKRTLGNTASALQLLQSAYNENDKNEKKPDKEDPPDAMDGLSDSDLETLLKNFNELSAEEQHSLVAYLKKMESKEPKRVERLREYVSAAVTSSAAAAPKTKSAPPAQAQAPEPVKEESLKDVQLIESDDDDDYTVEEVFKSAKAKVNEDQTRKEMEIVKKSLEEAKAPPVEEVKQPSPDKQLNLDNVDFNISSASNLLAMVQASIAKASSRPVNSAPEVAESPSKEQVFEDIHEQISPNQSMDLQDDGSNQMGYNQDLDNAVSYNQDMPMNNNISQMQPQIRVQNPMQLNMQQQNSGMYQDMGQNQNQMMPNNYDDQSGNQWDQTMDIDNSDMGGNYDNYDNNYNNYNEQGNDSNGMQDMFSDNYGVNANQNPNFGGSGNQNPSFGSNLNQNDNFGGNMKPQFGGNNSGGNFNSNRNNQSFRARGGGRGGPGGRGGGDGNRGDGGRGRGGGDGGRGNRGGRGGGDRGRGRGGGAPNRGGARGNFAGGRGNRGGRW